MKIILYYQQSVNIKIVRVIDGFHHVNLSLGLLVTPLLKDITTYLKQVGIPHPCGIIWHY